MMSKFSKTTVRVTGLLCLSIVCAAFALRTPVRAKPAAKTPLSFQEFLQTTLRHDPAFQLILIEEFYLKYQRDLQLPPRDLIVEITGQYGLFIDGETDERGHGLSGGIALNKLFPSTGTEVSLAYNNTGRGTSTANTSRTTLGLELSQDIARNAFGRATRMKAERIDVQTALARYQIIEAYEDYLASLLVIYLDWHTAEESRKAAQTTVNEASRIFQITRQKQGFGVAYQDETRKSYLSLLTARQHLIGARMAEKSSRRRIAALSGLKLAAFSRSVTPEIVTSGREETPGMEAGRTVKILDLLRKDAVLGRRIAEDDLLPSAKLFGGYQLLSERFDLIQPDQRVYGGASLSLNFGRQVEKARAETARLDRRKSGLENRRRFLNLELDRATVRDGLQGIREQEKIARQRLVVARQVYLGERNNYRLGQSDFTDLSRARTDVESARINLVQQKAALAQFQVEMMRLEDRLVRKLPGTSEDSE